MSEPPRRLLLLLLLFLLLLLLLVLYTHGNLNRRAAVSVHQSPTLSLWYITSRVKLLLKCSLGLLLVLVLLAVGALIRVSEKRA